MTRDQEKFDGTIEDLKAIIDKTNVQGDWRELPNGQHQFKAKNGASLNWWESNNTIYFQGKQKDEFEKAFYEAFASSNDSSTQARQHKSIHSRQDKTIFIVYGHDEKAKEQLELILLRLGLNPFILGNTSGSGQTIIEALEGKIGRDYSSDFGIVLMTPDDKGYAQKDGENKAEPRARQNVILEAGMLLSSLTRERVAFMVKGHLEPPSDLDGILTLNFNNHVKEKAQQLVERLRESGFKIDPKKASQASS